MNDSLEKRMPVAQEAARQAGKLLFENLRGDFKVAKKGPIDLVTEMDLAAEKLIVETIGESFPDDEVLAEERGLELGEARRRWIIDPLDGTTNYAHGYRFFCVSIAFEQDGRVELGAVYDPVTDEMYTARRGGGAYLNGQKLRVSATESLEDALLCTGFPYDKQMMSQGVDFFKRLLFCARAVRRDGSAALDLCYVAAGRFEGFWEKGLQAWDVAAGQLIVSEAGGRVTGIEEEDFSVYGRQIVASNGRIHQDLLQHLQAALHR
ncbi:MAG TPA: inositol monophosphatase family protein [Acidobacteriota bacterium]|nr:inositol monophosphatase family protein [Acidobacteriota bacterium]